MQARDRKKSQSFMEMVRTVVWAVVIALGIRTFAYEPFNIPSGSMIPTLLVGDYLFVSKLSYGYSRYSLPLGLPLIPGRILASTPERGDVAVFKKPTENEIDYIKRVIGLPGDKIQVKRGLLHINGEAAKRQRVADFTYTDRMGRVVPARQFRETLPNGKSHLILEFSDQAPFDNTPVFAVPAGHYFMMGDNRDNSVDSRAADVGFVPFQNMVGRAEVLFFSTDGSAALWEIWRWPLAIRFSRLVQGIE
jgi:signal peptidase I